MWQNLISIPWSHHRYIIDKCKDVNKAIFFVNKTLENNWSRNILLNFLDTNLYEREGKAITNFEFSLPFQDKELAKQILKDPYNFDFLTIRKDYDERELKAALIENIQKFLLELGNGFSFIGKEYRLIINNDELYIDLLFYNIKTHSYVVIEVKTRAFKPEDIGQLAAYVSSVNHILKSYKDGQTIGLLICKDKNDILAQYTLEGVNFPLGISKFELNEQVLKEYKHALPSIEEIENELQEKINT